MYSNKADIWSLGCILFEMATDKRAFSSDFAVFQYSISPAPLNGDGQETSNDLLEGFKIMDLLAVDPKQRPSARQLRTSCQILRYIERHNRQHPQAPIQNADGSALLAAASNSDLVALDCIIQDAELTCPSWWKEVSSQSMSAAVSNRNKEVVHRLLEAGVDGAFALFCAARLGDQSETRYLIDSQIRGASERHDRIRNALKYAIEFREAWTVKRIIRGVDYLRSADFTDLYKAIESGSNDRTSTCAIAEFFCLLSMTRVQSGESLFTGRIRYPRLIEKIENIPRPTFGDLVRFPISKPLENISHPTFANILDGNCWFTVSSNTRLDDLELDLQSYANSKNPIILCVAISQDGMYLGTRSWTSVCIFETELCGTLKMLSTPTSLYWEHSDRSHIPPLCFLADSQDYFLSGWGASIYRGHRRSISILDVKFDHNYFGCHNNGVVTSLAVSRTGNILISASSNHTVRIWNVQSEELLHEFSSVPGANISLSPDGHWMTIGSSDWDYISIWDIQHSRIHKRHANFRTAAFSPTGLLVLSDRVSPDQEGTVCTYSQSQDGLFDISKWGEGITAASVHLSFTCDGMWLVCGRRGRIEFRNLRTGALKYAVYAPKHDNQDEICTQTRKWN